MALFTALAIAATAAASAYAAKKQKDMADRQERQAKREAERQLKAERKAMNEDLLGTAIGDTNADISLGTTGDTQSTTTAAEKKKAPRKMLGIGGVSASKIGGL